ncbi:MAG: MATE family efflux transporter [Myxococcota bacterium]
MPRPIEALRVDEIAHHAGAWRAIWRMSWPSVLAAWLKSSFMLADTLCAGHLSTTALAGMSAAVVLVWMFHSLSQVNSLGSISLVAQSVGAGSPEQMRAVFRRAVSLAPVLGLVASSLMGIAGPAALRWMALPPDVYEEARAYLLTIAISGVGMWVLDTLEQSFRGTGDARTPLLVTATFASLNLLLNPLLAFGVGSFPGFGLVGIAIASGVAWFGGASVLLVIAWRRGWFTPSSSLPPDPLQLWRVGAPTAAAGIAFDLIWVTLLPLLSATGPAALAAVAVGHRLESLSYQMSAGIGMACAALVGQAWGMGRPDLARMLAARCSLAGFVLSSTWIGALLLAAPAVIPLFGDDDDLLRNGLDYLALVGLPSILQGVELIVTGAFSGTGRTLLPSVVMLVSYGARVPLARLGAAAFGAAGVFAAIGTTAGLSGLFVCIAFLLFGARRHRPLEGV